MKSKFLKIIILLAILIMPSYVISIIKIYPNPSDNILFIHHDFDNVKNISIYNIRGELLYSYNPDLYRSNRFVLDVSNLTSGNYFFKINNKYTKFTILK